MRTRCPAVAIHASSSEKANTYVNIPGVDGTTYRFAVSNGYWWKHDSDHSCKKAVATKISNTASDNAYDKAVKTLSALKGRSEKILVAPEGFISGLMLEKDNDGRYVFAPGSNFSQLLTAKIFEFDFMTDCGMDLIGFNDGKYLLPSGRDMLRSAFDNDYNQDVLLHEKPVAGSLN